jgi:hypothetical protein
MGGDSHCWKRRQHNALRLRGVKKVKQVKHDPYLSTRGIELEGYKGRSFTSFTPFTVPPKNPSGACPENRTAEDRLNERAILCAALDWATLTRLERQTGIASRAVRDTVASLTWERGLRHRIGPDGSHQFINAAVVLPNHKAKTRR